MTDWGKRDAEDARYMSRPDAPSERPVPEIYNEAANGGRWWED